MKVRLHEPTFGEEEIAAVVEVMRSTQVTQGAKVKEFEEAFGENAVMCNSGSSANLLAVAALCEAGRLKVGDGVIVSALSWSTTVWPLVQYGLVPIIVDIDPETLNIDPEEVDKAAYRARGLMPVHVYGNPCDMAALGHIARDNELVLIEDCCEALGAEYQGQPVGMHADIATFSFYFSHHITTVEGGMCTTHQTNLADNMRILRSHGWTRDIDDQYLRETYSGVDPKFLFVAAGYNLRATEMQAAMGLIQLPKLKGFVDVRRTIHLEIHSAFRPYREYLQWQRETPGGQASWFGFTVVVRDDAPFSAKEIREDFERAGIETRPIICGNIARQPGMKKYRHAVIGDLPNATRVMKNGFSIGCHQGMTMVDCGYVRDSLNDFMTPYG